MSDRMTLNQWIERFDAGDFDANVRDVLIEAGWYDWFCKDTSLAYKTKMLAPKVKQIAQSDKVDGDKVFVFFKNNCPMRGRLYDDFRICDLETGEVIFTIIPRSGMDIDKEYPSQVWGRANGFNGPIVRGNWRDVKKYFGV